ncbi:MAG: hypothetical protein IH956_03770 [Chloroflexi bacterium]|nr:hypothetical protein [Chloroflexota bacterium]
MATQTGRKLLLVDPTTRPIPVAFDGAPRISDLSNKRVGLIDDSKPNAKELLEEVASLLRKRFGVADVSYHRKPSASKPATPEVIQQLARDCDYVIVGVGD